MPGRKINDYDDSELTNHDAENDCGVCGIAKYLSDDQKSNASHDSETGVKYVLQDRGTTRQINNVVKPAWPFLP